MTRTFDLSPFTRTTIGFDRLFEDLDRRFQNTSASSYPPYNIVSMENDEYVISLAVAGFSMKDLDITKDGNVLVIEGNSLEDDSETTYLHKGIANRGFRRQFTLADHVEVEDATMELGMLNIRLKRHVPDELQPRKIAITNTPVISKE